LPDGCGPLAAYADYLLLGGDIDLAAIEGSPKDYRSSLLYFDFTALWDSSYVGANTPKLGDAFTKKGVAIPL
jgi:hypothetical protein